MTSSISSKLNQAFELRFMQRLEECLFVLAEVKRLQQVTALTSLEQVTLLCLEASVARAGGDWMQAQELLTQAQAIEGAHKSYFFNLSRALNHMAKGQFNPALQDFLLCHELASESPSHKAIALFNTMVCLQNLGLPFAQTAKSFEEVLLALKATELALFLGKQAAAFKSRSLLHCGDFSSLFHKSEQASQGPAAKGQFEYFKAWVAQLPYHAYHKELGLSLLEDTLINRIEMYQSEYRRRTLQGRVIAADLEPTVSASDAADRFYLLVWRWLFEPQQAFLEKAIQTLNHLGLPKQRARFTQEDLQLIRNALMWIELLDPSPRDYQEIKKVLTVVGHAEGPFFAFERKIIELFGALKNQQLWLVEDSLKDLAESPFWNQSDLWLGPLVRAIVTNKSQGGSEPSSSESSEGQPLVHLEAALKVSLGSSTAQGLKSGQQALTVNLHLGQLELGGKVLHSEALVMALDLLCRKKIVSIEEFAHHCFGIKTFDAVIHNSKISNLVSRLKALPLAAPLKVGVKNGKVWSELDAGRIVWIRGNPFSEGLKSVGIVLKARKSALPSTAKKDSIVQLKKGMLLSRAQLEANLNRPRSTVNRLIQGWESQGGIKRQGAGKKTMYQVLKPEVLV